MPYILELGLIGLCVAILPLSLVSFQCNVKKYCKLAWIAVFLTLDLIMFGAFTRLTDSGLGCPDWPGCYHKSSAFSAYSEIHAAQKALPSGPVTIVKAWIEMIHRYFAMALGFLIIVLMAIGWAKRHIFKQSPCLVTGLFFLICLQGAFGALTVTMKLQPMIVTTHLLLALLLLGMLVWLALRQIPLDQFTLSPRMLRWRWPSIIGLVLLSFQIALGGWVSTNYAVLSCMDFPKCHGQWVPSMDFHNGFALWRVLGQTVGGDAMPMEALVAIHWVHRTFAVLVVLYLGWLAMCLRKYDSLHREATLLFLLLFVQFGTGLSNIVFQWPLFNAIAHNGVAAILVILLVMLIYRINATGHFWPILAQHSGSGIAKSL
ncbi:COX15/CtaA family protein [Candidatus Pandoraea novymonadis]|uniref:Heme A synthase n=1 Tax=Candidatus Pandoraea novymonadis TaxID=1808959 RepID=A0ABX5FEW4_9BURK|nr:COX15/CtaA family protein [Candidatus Pandoraea novymonadis]PSB91752.1 Heme A synthase [Candidatus Pandoraea novymonadis]